MKIIGFDESGSLGDKNIIFSQVQFEIEREFDIFIHNLLNSKYFLFPKRIVNGWDIIKKIKICQNLLKNDLVKVRIYKLNMVEQNKIMYDINQSQGDILFKIRENLIKMYIEDYEENDIESVNSKLSNDKKELEPIISMLSPYSKPFRVFDTFAKSYSYLYILNKVCKSTETIDLLNSGSKIIRVEIDGGYPFSYWWHFFLSEHLNKDLLENRVFINGISRGDENYLSMNIADLVAKTFSKALPKFIGYQINDINYDFKELKYSKNIFFEKYWKILVNPFIRNRIIFIGKSELFRIIPYILYSDNRKDQFEAFELRNDEPIQNHFKSHRIKSSKKILIIFSNNLNRTEKDNIKYCEEKGLENHHISEYSEKIKVFLDKIEDASNFYSQINQVKIKSIINEKKRIIT